MSDRIDPENAPCARCGHDITVHRDTMPGLPECGCGCTGFLAMSVHWERHGTKWSDARQQRWVIEGWAKTWQNPERYDEFTVYDQKHDVTYDETFRTLAEAQLFVVEQERVDPYAADSILHDSMSYLSGLVQELGYLRGKIDAGEVPTEHSLPQLERAAYGLFDRLWLHHYPNRREAKAWDSSSGRPRPIGNRHTDVKPSE